MTTFFPPHPSSTLVNVSDDADLRLVRVLAPSTSAPDEFEKECAAAIADGDAATLLRTVIDNGAVSGLMRADYTLDEAVSAFSLLTVYLDRVGDAAVGGELCGLLADAVAAGSSEDDGGREKRSAMIAALFNLRSDGCERARLLARIVDLADASTLSPGEPRGVSALADALDPATLKSSLALWGDGVDDVVLRALYAAVSRGMDRVLASLTKDEGDKTTEAKIRATKERKQTYMLLFLETYKEEVGTLVSECGLTKRDDCNLMSDENRRTLFESIFLSVALTRQFLICIVYPCLALALSHEHARAVSTRRRRGVVRARGVRLRHTRSHPPLLDPAAHPFTSGSVRPQNIRTGAIRFAQNLHGGKIAGLSRLHGHAGQGGGVLDVWVGRG